MTIKQLTADNFNVFGKNVSVTGVRGPGMLLIHWTQCGHCITFKPVYAELDNVIGKDFTFASIERAELNKSPNLVNALDFTGFPTLKFFDASGKIIAEYDGKRDRDEILNHICKFYQYCKTKKERMPTTKGVSWGNSSMNSDMPTASYSSISRALEHLGNISGWH